MPGEVSLLVGAYEAQRGVFGLGWVIVVGALAAISGDNLPTSSVVAAVAPWSCGCCGCYMSAQPTSSGSTPTSVCTPASRSSLRGSSLLVRGLAALSAGTAQVRWRRFAAFNALGCVAWATAVTLLATLLSAPSRRARRRSRPRGHDRRHGHRLGGRGDALATLPAADERPVSLLSTAARAIGCISWRGRPLAGPCANRSCISASSWASHTPVRYQGALRHTTNARLHLVTP